LLTAGGRWPMTPNPAVNRALRIKPRKAGYLERWTFAAAIYFFN
jgi:hypothetical protein